MGKYANLIMLDSEDKVMGALKIIDFAASTVRQVMPGLKYQIPEMQAKKNPIEISRDGFMKLISAFPPSRTAEKFITSTFSGISTQIAHELTYRASGKIDMPIEEIDRDVFARVFFEWQELLICENYLPTLVCDKDGKPIDYSYMDITYLGTSNVEVSHFSSLRELFDLYFAEKDRLCRIHQRAHDLITLLSNATARTERKLALQRESLL